MTEKVLTETSYKPSVDPHRIFPSTPDDEIVISGIAGRYPSCDNVEELHDNLFNKVGLFCCSLIIIFKRKEIKSPHK